MHVELDHVFIFVEPHAPQVRRLDRLGLSAQPPRRHEGQGTANVCYLFQNAYFELIWVENEAEVTSHVTKPTMLWERSKWRETEACPFGICLRATQPTTELTHLPFATWKYRPPYLPEGAFLPVATNSQRLQEPLLFAVASSSSWKYEALSRERSPQNDSDRFQKMTRVRLALPTSEPSPELAAIHALPDIDVSYGEDYRLELCFDNEETRNVAHFLPELPLTIRW